jgi:hypothetical protein
MTAKWGDHNRARMTERMIRSEIKQIQTDLRNKRLRFTATQRVKLHERVAALQEELKQAEIERLEKLIKAENKTSQNPQVLRAKLETPTAILAE